MRIVKIILILSTGLLFACAKDSHHDDNSDNPYGYEWGGASGCTTGRHQPHIKESFCEEIRDDSRNNFCAADLRYQSFQQNCPGQAWNRGPGPRTPRTPHR